MNSPLGMTTVPPPASVNVLDGGLDCLGVERLAIADRAVLRNVKRHRLGGGIPLLRQSPVTIAMHPMIEWIRFLMAANVSESAAQANNIRGLFKLRVRMFHRTMFQLQGFASRVDLKLAALDRRVARVSNPRPPVLRRFDRRSKSTIASAKP